MRNLVRSIATAFLCREPAGMAAASNDANITGTLRVAPCGER
jgi:hypothetical protein